MHWLNPLCSFSNKSFPPSVTVTHLHLFCNPLEYRCCWGRSVPSALAPQCDFYIITQFSILNCHSIHITLSCSKLSKSTHYLQHQVQFCLPGMQTILWSGLSERIYLIPFLRTRSKTMYLFIQHPWLSRWITTCHVLFSAPFTTFPLTAFMDCPHPSPTSVNATLPCPGLELLS